MNYSCDHRPASHGDAYLIKYIDRVSGNIQYLMMVMFTTCRDNYRRKSSFYTVASHS